MIPKEPLANQRFRAEILAAAKRDPKLRKALKEICKIDILFWINAFVWQINYLKKDEGQPGPFITWPFQDRALLKVPGVPWDDLEAESATDEAGILWCMENGESLLDGMDLVD